jgi:hypothetical protein
MHISLLFFFPLFRIQDNNCGNGVNSTKNEGKFCRKGANDRYEEEKEK